MKLIATEKWLQRTCGWGLPALIHGDSVHQGTGARRPGEGEAWEWGPHSPPPNAQVLLKALYPLTLTVKSVPFPYIPPSAIYHQQGVAGAKCSPDLQQPCQPFLSAWVGG